MSVNENIWTGMDHDEETSVALFKGNFGYVLERWIDGSKVGNGFFIPEALFEDMVEAMTKGLLKDYLRLEEDHKDTQASLAEANQIRKNLAKTIDALREGSEEAELRAEIGRLRAEVGAEKKERVKADKRQLVLFKALEYFLEEDR